MTDPEFVARASHRGSDRNAAPNQPPQRDPDDLYRARHLNGFAVGVLLAAFPVWFAHSVLSFSGIFLLIAIPVLVVALALFVTGWVLTVGKINARHRRLFAAKQPDENRGTRAEPAKAATKPSVWPAGPAPIDANAGAGGGTMTNGTDKGSGEAIGMPPLDLDKLDKRWIIALLIAAVAAIGGWRWYMEAGAHVNAGLIKLEAAKEFPNPSENALVRAAARGDVGTIQSLARQGVNVNAVSAYRRITPLIWAVLARNQDSVRTLLALGADPNFRVPTAPGMEPMPRSDEETNDMVNESPISEAIRRNDFAILKLLLEHGGNPNIEGQGPPAVFEMSQLPDKRVNPMLQLMIDHGLDVNIKRSATTPLLGEMITTGQFETAIALLERGADVRLLDRKVSVPCSRYPKKTQLDDDELVVNYGAVQLQRITGPDGSRGDEVSRKLRKMLEARGVKMPFWDPDSIRSLEVPSLKELREKGTPDEVIKKIIRINKAAEVEEFGADLDRAIKNQYTYGHALEREYTEEHKGRK